MNRKQPVPSTRRAPVYTLGPANVWFCEKCRSHGSATFHPDASVWDAIAQIRKAHNLVSPDCLGTAFIRLQNLETLKARGLVA
jgi:hypothetical protein